VQIKEIAAENDLPQEYIAKILTTLVKARILHSDRGRDGGFTLRRRASEISVLDIVEAVDGPMESTELIARGADVSTSRDAVHRMFNGALDELRRALRERHIEQMLS
jgi:Rrf2 family protein